MRAPLLLALVLCFTGCEPTSELLSYERQPTAFSDQVRSQVLMAVPQQDLEVRVTEAIRGVHGGCLGLTVLNRSTDTTLVVDWSKIGVRLQSGQHRPCLGKTKFEQACAEFGPAAYGSDDFSARAARFPTDGEVYRIFPGESVEFDVLFGAPANEKALVLFIHPALHWETPEGPTRPIGPVAVGVHLPEVPAKFGITRAMNAAWPGWLHLNLGVSSDMF